VKSGRAGRGQFERHRWDWYEEEAEPKWDSIDRIVAWAKREQWEGRPVYVQMNPILWDTSLGDIQPTWLRADYLTNQTDYPNLYHENWTRKQRLSVLRLMEEHTKALIQRY